MGGTENIIEVSETTFQGAVLDRSNDVPVVVDFWAPWCGPCRVLGPMLERLAGQGRGAFILAKVNVDDNPQLAAQFSIRGIPAVKAFRGGRVVAEFAGAQPEGKVREFLKQVAPSESDRALEEALSLLSVRQWALAEAACRRALEGGQPDTGAATLGLIKALVAQGRGCEAAELIREFPRSDLVAAAEKLRPLADLLCEVETGDAPVVESDLDALYYNSARLLARGGLEASLDGLLDVLRQNKRFRNGEPRLVMLGIFELLGDEDPLTRNYRNELASVLF